MIALAVLLPPVLAVPIRGARGVASSLGLSGPSTSTVLSSSLLLTFLALIAVLSPFLPSHQLGLLALPLIGCALFGWAEEHFRLGSQTTIPGRLILAVACHLLGFGFDLSGRFKGLSQLAKLAIDLPVTVVFYLGIMTTFEVLDRLKGLATGVGMIVSLTLLSLLFRWAPDNSPLLALSLGGVSFGLLLLQSRKRVRLGRGAHMQLAVFLGASTLISRSWELTLTMLVVPMLAIMLPMIDRIYFSLYHLSRGGRSTEPAPLRSMLLDAGFSERWLVFFIWIVTTQFGVLVKVVYETKSPALAIAAAASMPLAALFVIGCLLRLGERLERQRDPDRLRILFLSHYFHPEVNAPASRLYEHARRWTAAGHDVTVICPAPSAPHGRLYQGHSNIFWQEEVLDGIRVIRIWTFLAANRGQVRRSLNYLSYMGSALVALLLVRRHDVLVATTPQFFCGLAGALASFFRKETFVLEVRDLWPESIEAVGAGSGGFAMRSLQRVARWMYRRARVIVAVGPGYRDKLLLCPGLTPDRVQVLPNGADLEVFAAVPEDHENLLVKLGIRARFVVSYVGTLGMAHGLDTVLEAAELLRDRDDIAFALVGDGAEHARLEKAARERGLRNVHFTGLLPKEMIPSILAESGACLVHLKRRELFRSVLPSKLFEAMAMGRPVLLGVDGDARDVLAEAGAGIFFEPENAALLAAAARQLADDPAEASRLGTQGAAFVREHYTRDGFAVRYVEILRSARASHLDLLERGAAEPATLPSSDAAPISEATAAAIRESSSAEWKRPGR